MKNFQSYYFESDKLFEFRIKVANVDITQASILESIKNAIDAYQLETISKPKRLPIQEHKDFGKMGPCEVYVVDVAVKYPTITEQIRQLVINRAQLHPDCICVYTKNQVEQADLIDEQLEDTDGALLNDPKLKDVPGAQELVGQGRVASLIKELETRKYEIAGTDKTDGERILLFIDNTGKTFGIDRNNSIKYMGCVLPELANSIYDGEFVKRRAIVWSLDFVCKGYLYGPVKSGGIIKFIENNFYIPNSSAPIIDQVGNLPVSERVTIQPGLSNTGAPINYYGGPSTETGTIPYIEIESDDDYGFITMIYNEEEINE